jgi:hypothetical protein
MSMQSTEGKYPTPPGLLKSLASGFDSVANHIAVILPPVLLDLFLWLGPRLRLKSFLEPFLSNLPAVADAFPSSLPDLPTVQTIWADFAEHFNLFILLRTFPVGPTSLLSLVKTIGNPLWAPLSLEAGSFAGILGWIVLLLVGGWLTGTLYYHWVSRVALNPEAVSLWNSFKQVLLLSLIWLILLLFLSLPILLVISILAVISPTLAQIGMIVIVIFLAWLLMPIFFSAHGIFSLRLDALRSILASLRMVRFTLPNTGLFLLAFVLINQGLNFLWKTPSQDSWWLLVGIAGHAFVSTALLASSFIYYRDINAWLKVIFEQLQSQATSAKA